MRDPYDVIGVQKAASETEIKKSFRRLAKKFHPDQNPDDPGAQDKFAEINQAYEILGDQDKRGQFDRGEIGADGKEKAQFHGFGGGNPFGGGRAGGSPFGADDIFSDIFGNMGQSGGMGGGNPFGGGQRQRTSPRASKGQDATVTISATLEHLVSGEKIRVQLPTGKSLDIKIPPGIEHGQQMRLKSQGFDSATGPSGDALITVNIVPHELFEVNGSDLRLELPITLYEAVLGSKIGVPTLSHKVALTIPAGTSSGKTMRLKGKGLPEKGGTFGDLYVTTRLVLPDGGDSGLEALMRDWQDMKPYNVRDEQFSS
ncbi:MAG: J domain-containing protein [Cohaesibacteraceae bacterium]|nr:J domain-containing protein [Cohaesibacteraceae bacterium]